MMLGHGNYKVAVSPTSGSFSSMRAGSVFLIIGTRFS